VAVVGVGYAVAVAVAMLFALVPAVPNEIDAKVLIASPPGPRERAPTWSGTVDQRLLADYGVSAEAARLFAGDFPGQARIWAGAHGTAVLAAAVRPVTERAREYLALALEVRALGSLRRFRVRGVDGASGFIRRRAREHRFATRVALRRHGMTFLLGVDANRPQPELVRELAVAQSERFPAGGGYGDEDWYEALSYVVLPFGALSFYLLTVNGTAALLEAVASARRRRGAGGPQAKHHEAQHPAVSVSHGVRVRRRVGRAAFIAKALGTCLLFPIVLKPLWLGSLGFAAAGLAFVALGVGIHRGNRGAAAVLLLLDAPFGFSSVGPGAFSVVRRGRVPHPPVRKAPGYRQLLTGKGTRRVVALLAVSAMVGAIGVFAFVANGLSAPPEGGDASTLQAMSALLCVALAVVPYRHARRHAALEAEAVTDRDPRPPILFLRSFGDDKLKIRARGNSPRHSTLERFDYRRRERFEEVVAGHLWAFGPVVAVSDPAEQLAPIGAARTHLGDRTWREGVENLMPAARLIVITVGGTAGLTWEIAKVSELGLWERTVLLFPPVSNGALASRWRALHTAVLVGAERFLLSERPAASAAPFAAGDPGGVLAAALVGQRLLVYTGKRRDEWHYEAALHAAVGATLQPLDATKRAHAVAQATEA
jgi:hypothetical protein